MPGKHEAWPGHMCHASASPENSCEVEAMKRHPGVIYQMAKIVPDVWSWSSVDEVGVCSESRRKPGWSLWIASQLQAPSTIPAGSSSWLGNLRPFPDPRLPAGKMTTSSGCVNQTARRCSSGANSSLHTTGHILESQQHDQAAQRRLSNPTLPDPTSDYSKSPACAFNPRTKQKIWVCVQTLADCVNPLPHRISISVHSSNSSGSCIHGGTAELKGRAGAIVL